MNDRYLYRAYPYRAKRIDNLEWVEGFYCKWIKGKRVITYSEKEVDCIITWMSNGGMSRYEVDPSTICQCTGLKDEDGKKIWENDIVAYGEYRGVVKFGLYDSRHLGFYIEWKEPYDMLRQDICYWLPKIEVVGNIFDEGSENIGK